MIIVIVLIIFIIVIGFQKYHAKHMSKEVIVCFTGTIGSGKTFLATSMLKYRYKLQRFLYKIKITKSKPIIYSNIPLYIDKKTDVKVLKREHLLLQEKFEENCCPFVLLDELSLIATCYNWDDPNIVSKNINDNMKTLETFIRFYRHFYGHSNKDKLRMFITDQATGSVNIQMRRRIGFVNYLYNMRRWGLILPFYKIDTKEMVIQEDTVNENNVDLQEKERQYYFGHLPYRWIAKLMKKKPCYDSHCFRYALITGNFVKSLPYDNWQKDDLTTNYCPDIRMTEEEKKDYVEHIKSIFGKNIKVSTSKI